MGDALNVVVIVAVAIGLVLLGLRMQRRRPRDPQAESQTALMDAARDRQKTEAMKAMDPGRHEIPPGMF